MARRRHSNRRRRGGFRFLYKLLSVLLICGAVVAALTLFFKVDTVVITGQQRYTEEQVRSASGVQDGDNLILLNKFDIQNRIREQLPYIELLRINRKLPDTLLVEVVKECTQPLAVTQDGSVWLVSASGKIVDQKAAGEAGDCPVIDGCTLLSPSVGTPMALAAEYAFKQESLLALLGALEEAGLTEQADAIHLDDASILSMDYAGRFTVEMSYGADYAYKLQTLLAILDSGKIQDNMTGTFDMHREDGKTNFIQNQR